jgi:hypothetical protein
MNFPNPTCAATTPAIEAEITKLITDLLTVVTTDLTKLKRWKNRDEKNTAWLALNDLDQSDVGRLVRI